jgi:hypothetical protein
MPAQSVSHTVKRNREANPQLTRLTHLCTVGPNSSMTLQKLRDLRMPLRALARMLSERLGWTAESLKNA